MPPVKRNERGCSGSDWGLVMMLIAPEKAFNPNKFTDVPCKISTRSMRSVVMGRLSE